MTEQQLRIIARKLGKLKGQPDIDEQTRLECIDAVEEAVIVSSNLLKDKDNLEAFRQTCLRTSKRGKG